MDHLRTAFAPLAPFASEVVSYATPRVKAALANPNVAIPALAAICALATCITPLLSAKADRLARGGWFKRNLFARVANAALLPVNLLHHTNQLFQGTVCVLATTLTCGTSPELTQKTFTTLHTASRLLVPEYLIKFMNPQTDHEGNHQPSITCELAVQFFANKIHAHNYEDKSVRESESEYPEKKIQGKGRVRACMQRLKQETLPRVASLGFAASLIVVGVVNGTVGTLAAGVSIVSNALFAIIPFNIPNLGYIAYLSSTCSVRYLRDTLNLNAFLLCAMKFVNPHSDWKINSMIRGIEIDNKAQRLFYGTRT